MWHLTQIPKILHTYWGGGRLPYLRYLTIESFHKYNPEWEIRFYYPKSSVKTHSWSGVEQKYADNWDDWFPMIDNNVIKIIEVPWDNPIYDNMSEVHRSDYFRWLLLSSVGGLWSDIDILFFKSIDALNINNPWNADKDTVVCISGYGHSIGFLMGSVGNSNFKKLTDTSLSLYDIDGYQSMGSEMFNKLFPTIKSIPNSINLGMEAVYFYDCSQLKFIFGDYPSPEDNPGSIGIHWYAGSLLAGDFLARTNGGVNSDNSLMGRLIQVYERNIYKNL